MIRHIFIGTFKPDVSDAIKNQVKADFDIYMTHPYHTEHVAKLGAAYVASYVAAQFEL